jgi:predicted 2-oxoglutarate/Fe(II)-dependent dioxygenase YbiX
VEDTYGLQSVKLPAGRDLPDHPAAVQLTGIYHNLMRRWADV